MNKQEIKNEVVRIMNEAGIDIDDSGMAEKCTWTISAL